MCISFVEWVFEPCRFGNLLYHSNHLHKTMAKIPVDNTWDQEILVEFSPIFGSIYVRTDQAKAKICPSRYFRNFSVVSRDQPYLNVHSCLSLVCKQTFPREMKWSRYCLILCPHPPVWNKVRLFQERHGDGALLMRMACPLQPPQARRREHLLLCAVCFNPLKDLSAKSSMEWCSVVSKEVPRVFELGRLRTSPFTCDRYNQTPISGGGKLDIFSRTQEVGHLI